MQGWKQGEQQVGCVRGGRHGTDSEPWVRVFRRFCDLCLQAKQQSDADRHAGRGAAEAAGPNHGAAFHQGVRPQGPSQVRSPLCERSASEWNCVLDFTF